MQAHDFGRNAGGVADYRKRLDKRVRRRHVHVVLASGRKLCRALATATGDSSSGGGDSSRLFLHSARLRFTGVADSGGVQQQRHEVSAALPRELAELLEGLTKVEE